jgi:hypothetical protein
MSERKSLITAALVVPEVYVIKQDMFLPIMRVTGSSNLY